MSGAEPEKTDHERIEEAINDKFDWLASVSTSARAANHWAKDVMAKLPAGSWAWVQWATQGDWRRLIQFFTNHQGEYGDDLFAQFGFRRNPSPGHRYLTLLVKLLSVRTIFTFNFDDLIEKALSLEGVSYRLFGMEHGSSLPSPRLVGDDLSVIKMHGSHHSILIDETLDRPLSRDYIQRFYELTGPNALILVLGCSGDDRRLGDLLANRCDERNGRNAEVCWLHFERESPVSEHIPSDDRAPFLVCPTNSPAAFVRHLLYDLTGRFPESAHPYPSHPATPFAYYKPEKRGAPVDLQGPSKGSDSFRSNITIQSSDDLLKIGASCINNGFAVIWVDLEAVHTLAGLVGAIIDGCRLVDPELPPAVMPVGEVGESVPNEIDALTRLEHALQRQRYAVLVDGVSTYGSLFLMHHSPSDIDKAGKYVAKLKIFLNNLINCKIGQSIIVASLADLTGRRELIDPPHPGPLIEGSRESPLLESPLLWACLATVRRTRPLPSLRRLLAPLVKGGTLDERKVDEVLRAEADKENSPLTLLEGGEVWFNYDRRNELYRSATRFTSKKAFKEAESSSIDLRECALAQSLLLALLHRKVADTYFTFEFMQSGDAASFMEYTYHCISGVRYLSRTIYLLERYSDIWDGAFRRLQEEILLTVDNEEFDARKFFPNFWVRLIPTDKAPASNGGAENDTVRRLLRDRRVEELEALLASWKEFEQAIRSRIPAEQLIRWVEEITSTDVVQRLNGAYVGDKHELGLNCNRMVDLLRDSQYYFRRLLVRIHLERGDFKKAREQLKSIGATGQDALLDKVECSLRGEDLDGAKSALDECMRAGDLSGEIGHRFRHMSGLLALGGTSWLGKTGEIIPSHEDALQLAEEGLEGVRGAGTILTPALTGMVVSSGAFGGAYRPYRSVFLALKGRARVAELLLSDAQDLDSDLATFRTAMRLFDQAKGGVGSQHALLRGWANLHAAESVLLFVRRLHGIEGKNVLGALDGKLQNCRTHIQSALALYEWGGETHYGGGSAAALSHSTTRSGWYLISAGLMNRSRTLPASMTDEYLMESTSFVGTARRSNQWPRSPITHCSGLQRSLCPGPSKRLPNSIWRPPSRSPTSRLQAPLKPP